MTECEHASELMSLALDGMAEDGEQRILEMHLATCERCAMTWEAMNRVSDLLQCSPLATPPARFTASVMAELGARERRRANRRRDAVLAFSFAAPYFTIALLMLATLSALWLGVPEFQQGSVALFAQATSSSLAVLRGLGVPFRMIGAGPCVLGMLALVAMAACAAGLWVSTLVWVDRRLCKADLPEQMA